MILRLAVACCVLLGGCFLSPTYRAKRHQRNVEARAQREEMAKAKRMYCLDHPIECEQHELEKAQARRARRGRALRGFAEGMEEANKSAQQQPTPPAAPTYRCTSYDGYSATCTPQ